MNFFDKLAKKIRTLLFKTFPFSIKLFLLIPIAIIFLVMYRNSVIRSNKTSPNFILWVWERPENLYFMKKEKVTYAFLAGSVIKTDKDLIFYPRRQPLRILDNSTTIAVIRIDDKSDGELFTDSDMEKISGFIIGSCVDSRKNIGCQIDFDATQSQIDFYKSLLVTIRSKLPTGIKLSITSLLSWCTTNDKPWFADSPIDEIIPMFFRLGMDSNIYRQKIAQNELALDKLCQKSIGISIDEALPGKEYLKDKKIYIFNNDYWDKSNWSIIKSKIENELNEN